MLVLKIRVILLENLFKPRQLLRKSLQTTSASPYRTFLENLFKPRQRRLAVGMVTDFVSSIYNLKAVL
ncbi:hypothetical protein [Streptococcus pneumoniae]|uniref:hypothetical protein n=1 Tax=Streptococcus pneumoniae TaxID=1313 RepID=UPI001C5CBC62|nr:hypothetical protein [Streptococcus pneumoniae]